MNNDINDNPIKKLSIDWEKHYKATEMKELHWYSDSTDPEVLEAIKRYCPTSGKVLDLGTGPGTMAIEFTKLGYRATATDISISAIAMAKERAGERADKIDFIVDEIRETTISDKYDIIHDRGCFHCLDKSGIEKYILNVPRLLVDNGILLIKTFSQSESREDGPNKYSYEMIKEIFSGLFDFLHCEETIYPSTLKVDPKAIFCVMRKI